mgnify:CR=1 FL=1
MTKRKDPKDYLPTGRPTKLTPETIDKLRTAFLMGCSDIEACLYADISKTALYNYQQKNPEFVDQKERWKEKLTLKARTVIADALNKKDENTAKWYLERKKRDEFSTRQETSGIIGLMKVEEPDLEKIKELKNMLDSERDDE